MSTINFLEYLNRRRHGVLTEAVATVDLDITRGLAVKQFLEERVQDVDATVIKVAVFTGKGDFPTIYETDNQIGVEHGYIRVIGLPDVKDNRECKVAALLQDIDAFIEHEGEDKFDIPVKIGIGQNGGQVVGIRFYYDDETNVVYAVSKTANVGWNSVTDFFEDAIATVRRITNRPGMTFENVEHALDLLNEDDLAENPDICESLFSLMSPAERKDAEALYPLLAAHAARFRAGQGMPPPEGVAQQEPADADEEPDEEAPAPQQKSGDNDEPAKKYEEVNGFTLAGEADALNVQEADNAFNEYVIALGKWPFDEFKDKLQALDGRIGGLITKKPILYRQIEYGQPIPGKKGGYNDIYNNFGLWFFDGFNNVTWLQYTRGTLIVYNRDDLPQFFFTTMLVRPATQWLYTFYTKTSGKAVRAGLKTVFNRRLNIANAVDAGQGAGEHAGAADNDLAVKMPEDKKEELIVKELIARMHKELVGKFYLDRNITTLPPPGKKYGHVIVKGAAPRIVDGKFQGFDMNKKHLFTDEDAVKLALSRSNWRYTGRDGATANVFNRIMNVDTINVKALLAKEFDFGVEREEAPDAAVQAAQAAIDAAMKPFRFGIANLVVGEFNRDERLPEDKNVLHVMMPGRDKTVLFNEQAKAFLERFGLYGTVADALKAAKAGGFGNIELALTRDNKLKKTA